MVGEQHAVACGNCGHICLLSKRPEWGGLDMPGRVARSRMQGT